jgi:hypothetical protein
MVIYVLTIYWSQPMWSNMLVSSSTVRALTDITVMAYQLGVLIVYEKLWTFWVRFIQIVAIFVSDFVVLTEEKRQYIRRTDRMTVARRAATRIFASCDELGTWITENIHTSQRITRRPVTKHRHRKIITAMSVLAMRANAHTERMTRFDTDSDVIGIDNRCSGCISHVRDDFIDTLRPTTRVIRGFGGSRTMNVSIGTLQWSWDDDNGQSHTFTIPNSYYVPDGHIRLLSPQHWAQSHTKNRQQRTERGEHTNGNECVLYWENGNYKRHVDLGRTDNVATITLTPGYKQFEAFSSEAE